MASPRVYRTLRPNRKAYKRIWRFLRKDAPIPMEVLRKIELGRIGNPILRAHMDYLNAAPTMPQRIYLDRIASNSGAGYNEERFFEGIRSYNETYGIRMLDDTWMDEIDDGVSYCDNWD